METLGGEFNEMRARGIKCIIKQNRKKTARQRTCEALPIVKPSGDGGVKSVGASIHIAIWNGRTDGEYKLTVRMGGTWGVEMWKRIRK